MQIPKPDIRSHPLWDLEMEEERELCEATQAARLLEAEAEVLQQRQQIELSHASEYCLTAFIEHQSAALAQRSLELEAMGDAQRYLQAEVDLLRQLNAAGHECLVMVLEACMDKWELCRQQQEQLAELHSETEELRLRLSLRLWKWK
jgi:hypothetical protein